MGLEAGARLTAKPEHRARAPLLRGLEKPLFSPEIWHVIKLSALTERSLNIRQNIGKMPSNLSRMHPPLREPQSPGDAPHTQQPRASHSGTRVTEQRHGRERGRLEAAEGTGPWPAGVSAHCLARLPAGQNCSPVEGPPLTAGRLRPLPGRGNLRELEPRCRVSPAPRTDTEAYRGCSQGLALGSLYILENDRRPPKTFHVGCI